VEVLFQSSVPKVTSVRTHAVSAAFQAWLSNGGRFASIDQGAVDGLPLRHPDPVAAGAQIWCRGGTVANEPRPSEFLGVKLVLGVIADPDGNEFVISRRTDHQRSSRSTGASCAPHGPAHICIIVDVVAEPVALIVQRTRRPRSPATLIRAASMASILITVVLVLGVFATPATGKSPGPTHQHGAVPRITSGASVSTEAGNVSPAFSQSNNSSAVAGIWQTTDGVVFQFDQSGGSASFTSIVLNDSCTGGPRTDFMSGMVTNNSTSTTLSGTMYRCSPANSTLDLNCSLDAIWSTPFNATITNGDLINGTYQGQYWTWNVSSSGQWTNCHIQSYFNATFVIDRIDCGLQSFQQLGDAYIADPTLRAQDVAAAMQLEAAAQANAVSPGSVKTPVIWSPAQSVPGGFKSDVAAFQSSLSNWGRKSTVLSAYRPITYQAYFADLKFCAQWTYNAVDTTPSDAKFLAASVAHLNYQVVNVHAFQNPLVEQAGNLTFYIPNLVCSTVPFTSCDHVNGRAVDLSINNPSTPQTAAMSVDEIGALDGFCRPAATIVSDANHWVYVGGNGFNAKSCPGVGPGDAEITLVGDDAPINLLVSSPSGQGIGYDPSTGGVIDTFPPGTASYSGPGTEPQVFAISSNATQVGNYSVSGVSYGTGPYTISYEVLDSNGTAVDGQNGAVYTENQTGSASNGTPITLVTFALQSNYSTVSPWTLGVPGSSTGGTTPYTFVSPNGTFSVSANSSTVSSLMLTTAGQALALESTGVAGQTSVTIPHGLLLGPYTVRANGSMIPSTTSNSGSFSTVTFQMPVNGSTVTIQGTSPGSSSSSGNAAFPWLALGLVGTVVVVGVAVGVAIMIRRRHAAPPPPPPPPPLAPPPPPQG
jgi:hypothetical protein